MMRGIISVAAIALLPTGAWAKEKNDLGPVRDKPAAEIVSGESYVIIQATAGSSAGVSMLTLIRRPEQADLGDYRTRRAAALTKAHAKWKKRLAAWESQRKYYLAEKAEGRAVPPPGKEPIEPTDANLTFPSIDLENMVAIGPLNRFSKMEGKSVYIHHVRPGRYAIYGPVTQLPQPLGVCWCMGTIEFEVKPGSIVNAGTLRSVQAELVEKAKAAGATPPKTDFDLPGGASPYAWDVPVSGDPIDPRLAAFTIIPADVRAAGRFPNYFGVAIDRLGPVPGVLDYDRDRVIDVKAGN